MSKGAADVSMDGFFGDNGKGKVADRLIDDGDYAISISTNGGPNSGRTVVDEDGNRYAMRQVPTGVHKPGVNCYIGQGTVVDPILLEEEIAELDEAGVDTSRIMVSTTAALISPWERAFDAAIEQAKKVASGADSMVGTTGKGIGPAYAHERYRISFRVGDLLNQQTAQDLLKRRQALYERLFAGFRDLGVTPPSQADMLLWLDQSITAIGHLIGPTEYLTREALLNGQDVLLDTHNGMGIGIKSGTYPNVSSSDMTIGGAIAGAGIPASAVRRIVLIIKAYSTRVGNGPFPTELCDDRGDLLRQRGHEFGTVTGRPRRCGWLDLPFPRFAVLLNGVTEIAVMKLDPLTGFSTIDVCDSYQVGSRTTVKAWDPSIPLEDCVASFSRHPGWTEDIAGIDSFDRLPTEALDYLRHIQLRLGAPVTLAGTGPERQAMVVTPNGVPTR